MAVDGSMHPAEGLFILDTAGKFGLEQADVEEMTALEMADHLISDRPSPIRAVAIDLLRPFGRGPAQARYV